VRSPPAARPASATLDGGALELNGDHQNGSRNRRGGPAGKVRRAGLAISRICRGMSYDEINQATRDARRRLGLRRPRTR
jgi:hypothetical protein